MPKKIEDELQDPEQQAERCFSEDMPSSLLGFPGQNLSEALRWFVANKNKVDDIIVWFEQNKDTVSEALVKLNLVLDMLTRIHSRLPLSPQVG